MQDILNTIGDTIGGFLNSPAVQITGKALFAYLAILWLAGAYWAFRDMQLRSENPVLPYLASALIVLFTPVLFVFGIIVYKIVRPQEKIGEVYERNLAEEALLAEVEAIRTCPACHRRIQDEWIICPTCRTRLNRVCANCGRLVGLDWSLCAWCGKDFERGDIAAYEPISAGLDDLDRLDAPGGRPSRPGTRGGSSRPSPRSASGGGRSAAGPVSEP